MKRVTQILVLATAVALGFWLYRVMFPDDADVIRKQLAGMAEVASFDASEGQIAKVSNAGKLANYFTIDAEISMKPWGYRQVTVNGRTEIRRTALGARSAVSSLAVSVDRIDVTVAEDRDTAQVDLSLSVRSSRQDQSWNEGMDVQMKRIEGDWLIFRVANRQLLKQ